jgi:hypothetical protein
VVTASLYSRKPLARTKGGTELRGQVGGGLNIDIGGFDGGAFHG